ncbi:MAG TPA: FAD-dependent oxidoreductase [Actinomycetota bacterium]|nr:FAD-dependent oxidoreductase [Actinomycetota bacterium]
MPPALFEADVVVAGGGPGGVGAAVAAARAGLSTVLLEGHGFLGGSRTAAAVDTSYGFWTPGERPRQVVGGVGFEIMRSLLEAGHAFERPNTYGAGPGITYDIERLKVLLDRMVTGAGAEVLFHVIVTSARAEGNSWTLEVAHRASGTWSGRGRYLIDATGDAVVAAQAGAPVTVAAVEGPVQSLTTIFFMAGVDVERCLAIPHEERTRLVAEADRSGAYRLPRHDGSIHRTPHPGVVQVNWVRVPNVDATDPRALAAAEMEGRRQAFEYLRFFRDRVPGCNNAYVSGLGQQIGVRETRRIRGRAVLEVDDIVGGVVPDDSIAVCAAPVEDHTPGTDTRWIPVGGGGVYGIPYGCLIPETVGHLLVVGRCLSATHDAQASVRNSAQAFATGEAAGHAVAAAASHSSDVVAVDVSEVRQRILAGGGILS